VGDNKGQTIRVKAASNGRTDGTRMIMGTLEIIKPKA